MNSGLPTEYDQTVNSYLTWNSLGGSATNHPFPSLKKFFELGGSQMTIPLSTITGSFYVNSTLFVNETFPVDEAEPTKMVTISYDEEVTDKDVTAWSTVVYSLLIAFFLLLSIGFVMELRKGTSEDRTFSQ